MKKANCLVLFMCCISIGLFAGDSQSQEPSFAEVLASTPNAANAVLYVDVPALRSVTAGELMQTDLPDMVTEVRIASEINLKNLQPTWEVGYITLERSSTADLLAKKVGGYVDSVAKKQVVWSPHQAYLVPMEKNVLGIVRPSDRKLLGRWLSKESPGSSSAYLKSQTALSTKFVSLQLAVDLADVWSPLSIEKRIENFSSLKGSNPHELAVVLSSIQGVRIIVGRKSLNECIVSLEFASSPSTLLPVVKNFLSELLSQSGASVPESSKWDASLDGNTISLRGTISPEIIDQLLGVFTLAGQASEAVSSGGDSKELLQGSESAKLEASKVYFKKTASLIQRVRDYSAKNTGDRARWNGITARRIDELPTLNVDPDLVQFGVKVAEGLRGNMVALQQANIQTGAAAAVDGAGGPRVGGYYANNGAYGVYANDSNAMYKYGAVAQAQGNYSYRELISTIDSMEGEVRRLMTEKYQVQF